MWFLGVAAILRRIKLFISCVNSLQGPLITMTISLDIHSIQYGTQQNEFVVLTTYVWIMYKQSTHIIWHMTSYFALVD